VNVVKCTGGAFSLPSGDYLRLTALLSVLALAACDRGSDSYVIGAAGPWKEGYGVMTRRGIDLAVDEINRSGGINGRPLEVLARDDEASGARAATIAQEFVSNPSVLAVVGHVNSGAMLAASRIYNGQLPAVATTASSPDLSGVSRWTFRVISSDSLNGVILARFASRIGGNSSQFKQAVVLYENDSYGRGLADAFRKSFRGTIISFDPIQEKLNPEPFVSYIRMRQPGIVFVAGREESALRILREARRQGVEAVFLGGDGWQGVVGDTHASSGVYVGTSFNAAEKRAAVQRFVSEFQKKHGVKPDAFAALAYDATRLIAEAVSTRGRDRAAIREYLASLSSAAPFNGVTGPVYFNKDGDPIGMGFHVAQVIDGNLVSGFSAGPAAIASTEHR
jgi:branched-chain amino acid transport system substrate-binding protein